MLANARASCRMMCDHLGTIGGPYVGNGTAQFRACGPWALGTSYWLSPGARGPQGPAQGWAGRARRHDPRVSKMPSGGLRSAPTSGEPAPGDIRGGAVSAAEVHIPKCTTYT